MIKPKYQVHLREIIIKIDDKMFHISRELLKKLSFVELEVINRKVKCVFQDYEALKILLEDDMIASRPEVYMKPHEITYKVRNGVGYFKLKAHLTPNNRIQIIHLIEEIRGKGNLNEDEMEIVQILQRYIASLSNLKGDEKNTPPKKTYKDDEDEEKKRMA